MNLPSFVYCFFKNDDVETPLQLKTNLQRRTPWRKTPTLLRRSLLSGCINVWRYAMNTFSLSRIRETRPALQP